MSKNPSMLGPFEYDVLRALIDNPDANYGGAIAVVMARPHGAVQTTLMRLEAKGMVTSTWGEPIMGKRGGRRRRLFRINDAGTLAIRHTKLHFQTA